MNRRHIQFVALLALSAVACPSLGQEISDRQLLSGEAFDLIVLGGDQDGKSHQVRPLPFENRVVPSPFPAGWLKVRLVDQPGVDYEVAWPDIKKIELFEQALLRRGRELAEEDEFNRAFEFYARLHREYPDLPELPAVTEAYLLANANYAFRKRDYDLTVALLLSINDRYPESPTLGRAVDAVAGKLIEARVDERDFRGARTQLDIIEQKFKNLDLRVIETWQERFRKAADAKVVEARQRLGEGDFRGARAAVSQAVSVLPDHGPSLETLAEINREYPQILVGVTTASLEGVVGTRLDAPAALRTSPLVSPTITQLVGYSGDGGRYRSPLGSLTVDDTGRNVAFMVRGTSEPFTFSRWLSRATDRTRPERERSLTRAVSGIRLDPPDQVVISMAGYAFRPEAYFRGIPLASAGLGQTANTRILERGAESLIVEVSAGGEAKSGLIEEQVFASDEAAVAALGTGAIDLIDDVPPWRLDALRDQREIEVVRYRLPVVHGLIPTKRNPLLDQREFRRALLYGINRPRILNEVLLSNKEVSGFRIVSGPFPYGLSTADPVRYGYNDTVEPRPFDPRLSVILSTVAWAKLQKEKGDEAVAEETLPTLTLAHASDPLARTACQSIQLQLNGLGYDIELVELSEPELLSDSPEFDLRYAELAVWEPAVDAEGLLGPEGIAGRCSDPMRAALERLANAGNTKEVQFSLFEIHRLAYGDLPILPLWQTSKHLAYRKQLTGVPESPVTLYSSASAWRKLPPNTKPANPF